MVRGWRNTPKNGKQLTIIEHPESYEVRQRGASTYFYFEDEPASRNSTGRMTRTQAGEAREARRTCLVNQRRCRTFRGENDEPMRLIATPKSAGGSTDWGRREYSTKAVGNYW